jgi:hypothetical protein
MWEDPAYRTALKTRWKTLRAGPLSNEEVYNLLDSLTGTVQQAQVRNFQRWPILNTWIWPNVFCCGAYPEHVAFLHNWIEKRLEWMDGATQTLASEEITPGQVNQTRVMPNPSSGTFAIQYTAGLSDAVQIRVSDPRGVLLQNNTVTPTADGTNWFEWPQPLTTPGLYFYECFRNNQRVGAGKIMVTR